MRKMVLVLAVILATLLGASGVALAENITCNLIPPCYGTSEGDEIYSSEMTTGTVVNDTVYALGGNDGVYTLEGDDTVEGGKGNDHLEASGGGDTVEGGKGNDTIYASFGDPGGGTEYSYGGIGDDTIVADGDGNVDIINCGPGTDTVYYDPTLDTVKGCEVKNPTS